MFEQRRVIVAAVVAGLGVGALVAVLALRSAESEGSSSGTERSLGAGVEALGRELPEDLTATIDVSSDAPFPHLTPLSETFRIDPSGPLPAGVVLTLPLNVDAAEGVPIVALTAETKDGPWRAVPAGLSPDAAHVWVQADHLSWFRIFELDVGEALAALRDGVFDGLTSNLFAGAEEPTCAGEDDVRSDGYMVTSGTHTTVLWCLGLDGGAPLLRVVNNRRYPLSVTYAGLTVRSPGAFAHGLEDLSRLVSGPAAIVAPSSQAEFAVEIEPGNAATLETEFDGLGWSLYQLQVGVDSALALLTRFGLSTDRSRLDTVAALAEAPECASAIGQTGGDVIAKCFSTRALVDAFGWRGLILGAAMTASSITDFFVSSFSGLRDVVTGDDSYRIVVKRAAKSTRPGKPTSPPSPVGPRTEVTLDTSPPDSSWASGFSVAHNWEWHEKTKDGYRYATRLAVGAFTRLNEAPVLAALDPATLSTTCTDFDPRTDAVAPAAVSMTNETTGFAAPTFTHIYAFPQSAINVSWLGRSRPSTIIVAAGYSSGVECHEIATANDAFFSSGTGWSVNWGELSPGESTSVHYAYVILPDFYTPNAPNGDPAILDYAVLDIVAGYMYTPTRTLGSARGPGLIRSPYTSVLVTAPLSGVNPCAYRKEFFNSGWRCGRVR